MRCMETDRLLHLPLRKLAKKVRLRSRILASVTVVEVLERIQAFIERKVGPDQPPRIRGAMAHRISKCICVSRQEPIEIEVELAM